MQGSETIDLGKKIFFLNPPYDFIKLIIPMLSDLEYETYVIQDYKYAKPILRQNPNSICFICIDGEMNIDNWYNYVLSFDTEEALSSIFLGVMSAHAGAGDRNHFLLNATIPAGFISLATKKETLFETLQGILRINEAKGIRKYVRIDCDNDTSISLTCNIEGTAHILNIHNISSAGLLCATSETLSSSFSQNMLIRDVDLFLHDVKLKCNVVVFKSFVNNGKLFLVLLFTKGLPYSVKFAIQTYIRKFLQRTITKNISTSDADETDYSKRIIQAEKAEDAFLIEVEEEDTVLYADDLEQL